MTPSNLLKAEHEANRFLETIHEYYSECGGRVMAGRKKVMLARDEHDSSIPYEGGRYPAAIKRASMDLTRALADLRKVYNHGQT